MTHKLEGWLHFAVCVAVLGASSSAACSSGSTASSSAAGSAGFGGIPNGSGGTGSGIAGSLDASGGAIAGIAGAAAGGNAGATTGGDTGSTAGGMAGTVTSGEGGAAIAGEGGAAIGGQGGAGTGSNGEASDVYPAPHSLPPQVTNSQGAILAHPKISLVTFNNDDPSTVSQLTDFVSKIGATSYWSANTTEYGVGAATSAPSILLSDASTGTVPDAAIQSWLAGKLNSNDPAFPAPDANTLLVLAYPQGTTVTLGADHGCTDFWSYHSSVTMDAAHSEREVAYVVVPRCGTYHGLTGIDATTAATSAALLDAATDPQAADHPAWSQVDNGHLGWVLALGSTEICGMCAQEPSSYTKFAELGYVVQRCWSNAAAAAGHDPCVPKLPGEVYFNAAPVLPDMATVDVGQASQTQAIHIPVGQHQTIEVGLFSDAATTGPITVTALDQAQYLGGAPKLSFAFDSTSGLNGQHLNLTITAITAGPGNAEPFRLTAGVGADTHSWIGLVGN